MIANFSVSNYRSIHEEQSVSFLTTAEKANRDLMTVEVAKGVYINKLAIFFGANASGKSNILQAMEALFLILCTPFNDKRKPIRFYCPFKLDDSAPINMAIEFYIEGRHYWYDVRFNKNYIEEENLYYTPLRGKALFYSRFFTGPDSQPDIKFGSTLKLTRDSKERLRELTFNNHSVLASIAKLSLKEDAREFKKLYNWVVTRVHNINGDTSFSSYAEEFTKINSDLRKKEFYIKLLAKADFNIVGFRLVDDNSRFSKEQRAGILSDPDIPESRKVALLNDVVFTNRSEAGDFELPLKLQSEGTLRFIDLLEALYDLVSDNHIYFLDELGNRMHYDLIVYYILLFLYNSDASQLFFTSQSILLLDEDFVRRDTVYLAEKDPLTASTSYMRVSDLGLHKNMSLFNAYRIGKLGFKPELGSPYLNLKKS